MNNIFLVSLLLGISLTSAKGSDFTPINDGILDLRNWNDAELPIIPLNGKWAFYWEKLLSAKDLQSATAEYAEISLPWNEQTINGKVYPRNGCATYVLKVLLPPGMKRISIWIPAVFNSSSLWVNDSLIVKSGKVTTDPNTMEPMWKPNVVDIETQSSVVYLSLQIANYQGTRGGCAEIPKLSKTPLLSSIYDRDIIAVKALIVIFVIIILLGLVAYATMGVKSYLGLSLVSASFVTRFLFSDLYMIYQIGAQLSWFITIRLEYCSIPIIILCASYFINLIYPLEFGRKLSLSFSYISAIAIILVAFLPTALLSQTLFALQLIGITFAVTIMVSIFVAVYRRRRGAWLSATSLLCFAIVGFYNIYTFIFVIDLNRVFILVGYTAAMILSLVSLSRRTPIRLKEEESSMLRYEDLYNEQ